MYCLSNLHTNVKRNQHLTHHARIHKKLHSPKRFNSPFCKDCIPSQSELLVLILRSRCDFFQSEFLVLIFRSRCHLYHQNFSFDLRRQNFSYRSFRSDLILIFSIQNFSFCSSQSDHVVIFSIRSFHSDLYGQTIWLWSSRLDIIPIFSFGSSCTDLHVQIFTVILIFSIKSFSQLFSQIFSFRTFLTDLFLIYLLRSSRSNLLLQIFQPQADL